MSKKKFKDTTVGQLLFGAASVINPTLGNVLQGVTSPKEAIAEIIKSDAPADDKIKFQQIIYEQQNKEIEAITSRWEADSMSDSWMSKNVRPLVLVWCIVVFSFANLFTNFQDSTFVFKIKSFLPIFLLLAYLSPIGCIIKSYKLFINILNHIQLILPC